MGLMALESPSSGTIYKLTKFRIIWIIGLEIVGGLGKIYTDTHTLRKQD